MAGATLAAVAVLAMGVAGPDVSRTLDRTPAPDAAKQLKASAAELYRLTQTSSDPRTRGEAEYHLAQALERGDLPAAALIQLTGIVRTGPAHPLYAAAFERLIELQRRLGDEYLIPTLISAEPLERWTGLSAGARARASFLLAKVEHRQGNLEKAQSLLDSIPAPSDVYAQSRYLLGIIAIDPRLPGGPRLDLALQAFREVLSISSPTQEGLSRAQQLSILGLARVHYGLQEYAKSVEWYERIPRFSQFWDQALFENGFARFQNGDPGGALGSLQSLHAPQFEGSFQPESWVLTATIYYFNCLYNEARAALASFDATYPPMSRALEGVLDSVTSDDELFALVGGDARIPRSVLHWTGENERVQGIVRMLSEVEREIRSLERDADLIMAGLAPELLASLQQNRGTLRQVGGRLVRNRLEEAARNIKTFSDQAEIIRFETSKAEKELAEAGMDQQKILQGQVLRRPALPSDAWQYWKFGGEFWLDEIGYYQHTLKRGCPIR